MGKTCKVKDVSKKKRKNKKRKEKKKDPVPSTHQKRT